MKYHFDNIQQFDDFITDAIKKGTFSESKVKIGLPRPSLRRFERPMKPMKDWDWAEPGYLYLTTNMSGVMYYVYRPPSATKQNRPYPIPQSYVWWSRGRRFGDEELDLGGTTEGSSGCWATRYLKLEESFGLFMNWGDENPLEMKG